MDEARARLASALNQARIAQHLSIRAAAKIAGVPAATMQGWLSGRYFPTPALRGEYARLADALGLGGRLTPAIWGAEPIPAPLIDRPPFLGLSPYRVDDADLFFGRDSESDRLGEAVHAASGSTSPIVVVVGGSGSGKSSLVASGLAGRECMESGRLSGWIPRFLELSDLAHGQRPHAAGGAEVWIVDHIEDAIASGQRWSPDDFAHLPARVVLVLVVRADAFGELTDEPNLAEAVAHPFVVAPMTAEDVRQVVRGPLERAGVRVDPALVEMILRDAGITSEHAALPSGSLPLLSNALLATWQSRRADTPMSASDYLANGGLPGSVDVLAERVFAELDSRQTADARTTFLTLVEVKPSRVLRRAVPRRDLTEEQLGVLGPFLRARLVTINELDAVEIGHDALLTNWRRLADWIQEDRDSLRALELVRRAADTWEGHERPSELLLPLTQLPGVQRHVSLDTPAPLTRVEQEFVSRSTQHFAARLEQEKQQNRRLRLQRSLVAGLLAVSVVLGAGIGSLAWRYRTVQLAAESRQVASDAASLVGKDPNLRAQMSLIANRLSHTQEARSAVIEASGSDVPTRWLGHGSAAVAASPDGSVVVRADGSGGLTIWRHDIDTSPGQLVSVGRSDQLYGVAVGIVDGRTVAAVAGRSTAGLWQLNGTPHQLETASMKGTAYGAAVSTAARLAAITGETRTVILSLDKGTSPLETIPVGSRAVAMGNDGTLYLAADPAVSVWKRGASGYVSAARLVDPAVPTGTRAQALAISPDGRLLAVGYTGPRISVFDLRTHHLVASSVVGTDWINGVSFSPDSAMIAVGSSDQHTYVLRVPGLVQERVAADPSKIVSVAWSGADLVTSGVDGTVRVWPANSRTLRQGGDPVWQFASDANATKWFAASPGGKVLLWRVDGTSFTPMPDPTIPAGVTLTAGVAIAPDGASMVAAGRSGELVTWALGARGAQTPRVDQVLPSGVRIGSVAYSADSTVLAGTLPEQGGTVIATRRADGSWRKSAMLDTATPLVASFDPQAPVLFVGIGANAVTVWDISDPSRPVQDATIPNDATPSVQMPGAGHLLAVGSDLGTVSIWDTTDPRVPVLKQTHHDASSAIYGLAFDPSASILAAASGDGLEWGWSVSTGRPLFALDGGFGEAYETRFAADGQLLVATGQSGIIRVWTPNADAARAELCRRIGDPVTETESTRYLPGIGTVSPCG